MSNGGYIKQKILGFIKACKDKKCIVEKRLRNRTPDGIKNFIKSYLLPYSGILLIAGVVFIGNFAHAANQNAFIENYEVMDLNPVEVATVVNAVNPYTPNYQEDSVQVVLAMKNDEFLGKPVILETAKTEEPKAAENRTNTISYKVQAGETLSSIGWKYGLKLATIKGLNNLSGDTIREGQILKLPPADLSASYLAQLSAKKKVSGATAVNRPAGSKSNAYPYGWCTYHVASRRYVPGGWGNAKSWLSSARSAGYPTGSQPVAGAIMVSNESWMGHVAYVESVSGSSFTVSEMNYKGWGVTSRRTISKGSGFIMGFIY